MKRSVIIAAGGSGQRMGTEVPKQFLLLNNRPIILQTIDAFLKFDASIQVVIVLPKGLNDTWAKLIAKHNFTADVILAEGGSERFQSIKNGLEKCTGDLIAIHDAVRPLVSQNTMTSCFETAEITGAAIPALQIKSSLRKITFDESEAVDRSLYREVQTPQVFKSNIVKMAYSQDYNSAFTDDASVVEACGHDIALVNGNEENIKITTPFDLKVAETLFNI